MQATLEGDTARSAASMGLWVRGKALIIGKVDLPTRMKSMASGG